MYCICYDTWFSASWGIQFVQLEFCSFQEIFVLIPIRLYPFWPSWILTFEYLLGALYNVMQYMLGTYFPFDCVTGTMTMYSIMCPNNIVTSNLPVISTELTYGFYFCSIDVIEMYMMDDSNCLEHKLTSSKVPYKDFCLKCWQLWWFQVLRKQCRLLKK